MNLAQLLHEQTQMRPLALALRDYSGHRARSVTYGQLDQAAAKAAALLRNAGLQSGDRVLLFLPISVDLYIAIAALFRLGMAAIFIDPGMGRSHIERCASLAAPQAFIGQPKAHLLRLVSVGLRRIPIKFATGIGAPGARRWRQLDAMRPLSTIVACPPETAALITFTSGSTGQPKMVVRSHQFLLQQHAVISEALPLPQGPAGAPVILTNLPIFVLSNLAGGKTTLIPDVDIRRPAEINPQRIVALAQRERVTAIEASPAFVEKIIAYCANHTIGMPDVSHIYMGGAPVFLDQIKLIQRTLLRTRVTAVYGSTEAEPIARLDGDTVTPADLARTNDGHGLLVGKPVAAARVQILADRWGQPIGPLTSDAFAQQAVAPDKVGEIVVSGPHVLRGYWQGIGDAETKIHVGGTIWHRTGDAGMFDDAGRLWLLGRCVARIQDRHGEIYPFAVECAVRQFASIRRSAFVQYPQPNAGVQSEGSRLLIIEHDLRGRNDLADEIRLGLAWAHIDEILFVDRLPVDPRHNSKIDYPALYRLLDKQIG